MSQVFFKAVLVSWFLGTTADMNKQDMLFLELWYLRKSEVTTEAGYGALSPCSHGDR